MIIVAVSLLRLSLVVWGPLDLAPDEAQYWDWSRHLDWSYYSKGPAIAYIIAASTALFGSTELGVRLPSIIISALLSGALFILANKLFKSRRVAFFSAIVPLLTPLFTTGAILMTTDPPLILFYTIALYFFYSATSVTGRHGGGLYWVCTGIFLGLGLLCKYTALLIYPSLFLFLLVSAEDRKWFFRPGPYIAFFISILFFVPEVLWNMKYDWVTFRHVLGQTHAGDGFVVHLSELLNFVASQAGVLSPLIFLGVLYGIYRAAVEGFRGSRAHLLLFFTSAPLLLFFVSKSLQGKVQANWAVLVYVTGIIAGVVAVERAVTARSRFRKSMGAARPFAYGALLVGALFTLITYYPKAASIVGYDLHVKKPFSKLLGWQTLGERAGAEYDKLVEDGPAFIFSDRYQITSELAFYMPGNPVTYNANFGRRMNQYDLWDGFGDKVGHNALYVEWHGGPPSEALKGLFERCDTGQRVEIVRDSEPVRLFMLYSCYDFKGGKSLNVEKW
ncbi:MAG: glycosyltransferase family 39 protein [Proteobacteria bacterium]|nr:glycosyltransferase family 39 protein [Pseudomonadota bacterium]